MKAQTWVRELQRQASAGIVIALVGNKLDLASRRAVDFNEAKGYAEDNSLVFMETSAKTAANVVEVFTAIATKLPKGEGDSRRQGGQDYKNDTVQPKGNEKPPKSTCCK